MVLWQCAMDAYALDTTLRWGGNSCETNEPIAGQELHGKDPSFPNLPLRLHKSRRADANLWIRQISFAQEEEGQLSHGVYLYSLLIRIVYGEPMEVVEAICNRA